jgi:hypothetical protein
MSRPDASGEAEHRRAVDERERERPFALALSLAAGHAFAGMEEAKRWVDTEFQPSTLSKERSRR